MPPCNDPRIRAVHCPGGFAGFYGRFFSHVPRVTTRGARGHELQCMLCAVRVLVRACDPVTDEWREVEVYECLTGHKFLHGVPPSLLYLTIVF